MHEAVRAYKESLKPSETRRGYDSGLTAWEAMTRAAGLKRDQVDEVTLTAFVEWRWAEGRAPNTIRANLTGLAVRLRGEGVDVDPAEIVKARAHVDALVARAAVEGEPDRGRGQAPALALDALRNIVGGFDLDTRVGVRDRVLFCLGFALAARSQEMAGLRVGDVREVEAGLVVGIRVSKTGRRTANIPYGSNPVTCPVRAWQAWRREAGFVPIADAAEAVVQRVHRSGAVHGQMTPKSVRQIIKARGVEAGYEITSHSLRAGLITAARRAGKDVKAITDRSGHSTKSGQVYTYMREVDPWRPENNATMGIGL